MPHRTASIFTATNSEHMAVLRLQWALWKVLAPKIIMDSERFQRMAESMAQELFDAGVRFPAPLAPPIVAARLEADIHHMIRTTPEEFARDPRRRLVERVKMASMFLAGRGWRQIVGLCLLLAVSAQNLLPLVSTT